MSSTGCSRSPSQGRRRPGFAETARRHAPRPTAPSTSRPERGPPTPSSSSRRGGGARASTRRRSPRARARTRSSSSGDVAAAADAWTECERPYDAALARADIGTEEALRTALSRARRARCTRCGHGRVTPPAAARRAGHPARTAAHDPRQRGRAHRPRERGAGARRRRAAQRRYREAAPRLRPHGRPPRVRDSEQAPRTDAWCRRLPRPGVSGCSKTGSADAKPR